MTSHPRTVQAIARNVTTTTTQAMSTMARHAPTLTSTDLVPSGGTTSPVQPQSLTCRISSMKGIVRPRPASSVTTGTTPPRDLVPSSLPRRGRGPGGRPQTHPFHHDLVPANRDEDACPNTTGRNATEQTRAGAHR